MSISSHPKLEGFDLIQATYKQIGDHAIRVDILIPQTPYMGKRPTLVRTHGGALVTTHQRNKYYMVVNDTYRLHATRYSWISSPTGHPT